MLLTAHIPLYCLLLSDEVLLKGSQEIVLNELKLHSLSCR